MVSTFANAYMLILEELNNSLLKIKQEEVERLLVRILQAKKVFVVGAGRMGLITDSFSTRLNHLGIPSHIVGSINCPPISSEDLLIVASSSGETATVREIVRRAVSSGAAVAAITAVPRSTVGKLSSFYVFLEAPSTLQSTEEEVLISVQPMKTLFEQSLFILFEALVLLLMDRTQQNGSDLALRHTNLE